MTENLTVSRGRKMPSHKNALKSIKVLAKVVIPVKLVPACFKRGTGIQRFYNILKILDSHSPLTTFGDKLRGNDEIGFLKTFARASSC